MYYVKCPFCDKKLQSESESYLVDVIISHLICKHDMPRTSAYELADDLMKEVKKQEI